MILGAKARYAVMAMVELAGREPGSPVTLAELARSQDIPLSFLEQIFARLRQEGLVRSVRGPGGGYVLARDADAISIADIVRAADESLKMTRCGADTGGCTATRAKCRTHNLWEGLEEKITDYLDGIRLGGMVPTANHAADLPRS